MNLLATDWVDPTEIEMPFFVKYFDPEVYVREITVKWTRNGIEKEMEGVEFLLPDRRSKLLWCPWPDFIPIPAKSFTSQYHEIKHPRGAGLIRQPRRTRCYVHSYKYSGVPHVLEPNVPADLQNLLEETTAIYNVKDANKYGTPGCLVNEYTTKRHCIHAHGDDEKQFGQLRDVVCWIEGATRRVIIRDNQEKIILNVEMPQGLYVMKGRRFQKTYTHEIPRELDTVFTSLQSLLPENIKELESLDQADWLASHPKYVQKHADNNLYERYKKWAVSRTSYTIRYFLK